MKKVFTLLKTDKKKALLIDPDYAVDKNWLTNTLAILESTDFDLILVGGSIVDNPFIISDLILDIKNQSNLPVYLFPGHTNQVSEEADGILFISLISGRNPEYLIGQQVLSAPLVRSFGLNVIPTGYMLVGDSLTSAHYISQTQAIPYNKPTIALATAIAGEMLGLKTIYIDGGSGSDRSPSLEIVHLLSRELKIPLIVGGGVKNSEQVKVLHDNGANLVVIGTAVEKDSSILLQFS